MICAIGEVKVNQGLIRYARSLCLLLKILDDPVVDVDCDLFFQLFCVGVLYTVGKIIFI